MLMLDQDYLNLSWNLATLSVRLLVVAIAAAPSKEVRWCRSYRPQPPATSYHPSGMTRLRHMMGSCGAMRSTTSYQVLSRRNREPASTVPGGAEPVTRSCAFLRCRRHPSAVIDASSTGALTFECGFRRHWRVSPRVSPMVRMLEIPGMPEASSRVADG
jgi:hypothetical protein